MPDLMTSLFGAPTKQAVLAAWAVRYRGEMMVRPLFCFLVYVVIHRLFAARKPHFFGGACWHRFGGRGRQRAGSLLVEARDTSSLLSPRRSGCGTCSDLVRGLERQSPSASPRRFGWGRTSPAARFGLATPGSVPATSQSSAGRHSTRGRSARLCLPRPPPVREAAGPLTRASPMMGPTARPSASSASGCVSSGALFLLRTMRLAHLRLRRCAPRVPLPAACAAESPA